MRHKEKGWAPPLEVEGMVDNHAHVLSIPGFVRDLGLNATTAEEVLQKGRECGVERVLEVACEEKFFEAAAKLSAENPDVSYALSVHPTEAARLSRAEYGRAFANMERVIEENPKGLAAVGESGMDFFHAPRSTFPAQKKALVDHVRLANDLGLPLQVHDHGAHAEVFAALKESGAKKVVFHSFSGGPDLARAVAEEGWYLSFSGMLTFKNAPEVQKALLACPKGRILAETDSPCLSPSPYRGRPNAPWMLGYTLRFMGDLLNVSAAEAAKITRENAQAAYEFWR